MSLRRHDMLKVADAARTNAPKTITYTNLIINPSYETDLTGWAESKGGTAPGGVAARSEAQAKSGSTALKITMSSNFNYQQQHIVVPTGHILYFKVSAYLESGTVTGPNFAYVFDDINATNILSLSGVNTVGAWQELSGLVTVTNGGVTVRVGKYTNQTAVVYYDAIMLVDLTALCFSHFDLTDCRVWLAYADTEGTFNVGSKDAKITIAVMTDLHLDADADGDEAQFYTGSGYTNYFYAQQSHMRRFVDTANALKPDAVLHLGDISNVDDVYLWFGEQWNAIISDKYLLLGNHDAGAMDSSSDINRYNHLRTAISYQINPLNGNSYFNQSYVVTAKDESVSIRIVLVDLNVDNDGIYSGGAIGNISAATLAWLQNELSTSVENNILLCTHQGNSGTNALAAASLTSIVSAVSTAIGVNPDLKVTWIFGHSHLKKATRYVDLTNLPNYNMACCVNSIQGRYNLVTIDEDYNVSVNQYALEYKYPKSIN